MKVQVTHIGHSKDGDTISIFDSDGREIAVRRCQLGQLCKLLKDIEKKPVGSLKLLEYCGVVL